MHFPNVLEFFDDIFIKQVRAYIQQIAHESLNNSIVIELLTS